VATKITSRAKTDLDKARAIYEWIVDNTFRNPKTRGCGFGDIRFMLESNDLGGKCADLNALLCRISPCGGPPGSLAPPCPSHSTVTGQRAAEQPAPEQLAAESEWSAHGPSKPRAISRFARLAHAISSTNPVIDSRIQSGSS